MSALLYINPLLNIIDPTLMFNGRFVDEARVADPDRPIVNVKWNNFDPIPKNQNAHDGMMELVRLMRLYPGTPEDPTDVVCHSGGSSIADKFCREWANRPDLGVDLAGFRFWLAGDPEMCFTGAAYLYPDACPPVYPGVTPHTASCPTPAEHHGPWGIGSGLPPTVNVEVNYVIHQYDGWAMAPVDPNNPEMRRASGISLFVLLLGQRVWDFSIGCLLKQGSHKGKAYYALELDGGPANGVFTFTDPLRPKVKHHYVRQYPVPSLFNVSRNRYAARDLDIKRRPVMDQAYGPYNPSTRRGLPVTITAPDYGAMASWFS